MEDMNTTTEAPFSPCVSEREATIIAWIVSCLVVLIFIGNSVVIIVIMRTQAKNHTAYIYTLSLAFADIFVGFMCLVHVVFFFSGNTSTTWCLWEAVIFISACSASVSNIICIAFDRYLAITKPVMYSARIHDHTWYAKVVIATVWVLSLFYGSLPLLGWRTAQFIPCRHCWFVGILPGSFVVTLFFTQFIVPVFILLFLYGSMLSVALRQANQIADLADSVCATPGRRWEQRRRAVVTLTLIMGCFFVTWAPFFVILFIHMVTRTPNLKIVVHSYFFILAISNSCLNPLVYAYWNREFRKIFSKWFISEGRKIRHSFSSTRRMTITFISGSYGNQASPSPPHQ